MCALLAVAVLLVFGRTCQCEFITYDDGQYFSSNPHVQAGLTWGGVAWAFKTGQISYWQPLSWLSLMLDVELFGSGPMGPHLTNLLLHATSTVLLFLLLNQMTGAYWRSALVAALFALHPLHVESVAWVSERKDVLSGLFFILTLRAYARYAQKKSRAGYWLALVFFSLGLMSKPMLMTLPFVMLLLDWWPLRRFSSSLPDGQPATLRRLVLEKLPFLALSVVFLAATIVNQKRAMPSLVKVSMGIRVVNAIVSYVRYLLKMFWPVNLAIPYPHPGYWSFVHLCLSVVLLGWVSLAVMRAGRRFPYLITGWLWYLGMLVPVIGLVQVGVQSMADRYTYLPLVGVFIMLVWGAGDAFRRWRTPKAVIWGLAIIVLTACTARTVDQLKYWQNSETLFRHAIAVTKYNVTAYSNLAAALVAKGEFDDAVALIRESLPFTSDKPVAHYNIGNIFLSQNRLDEAIKEYNEALQLKPDFPQAHNNLAGVLLMEGYRDAAIQQYEEVLRLDPNHETARRQLQALGVLPPQ
ncbi:MAG: tetratricopeptide repeat protein [Verrucomicrobiota bacterium]